MQISDKGHRWQPSGLWVLTGDDGSLESLLPVAVFLRLDLVLTFCCVALDGITASSDS